MTIPKIETQTAKILLIVLFTIFLRIPVLIAPKAIDDERIYSVVAIEMLDGGLMYKDAIERKPPLLFWTYEAILGVGGNYNWHFLHFAGLLWVLLTMWGIFKIAKHLFDNDSGLVAALLYPVFVSWAFWKNLALNGEILMNLPVVWGIYFVLKGSRSFRLPELLLAGMLLCCGFLLKQPAAIMAIPLGFYLLSPGYRKKANASFFTSFIHASGLTAGFFGALALVVLVLHLQGNLEEAYYWTIGNHDIPHGIFDPVFWIRGARMSLLFCGACGLIVFGTFIAIKMGNRKDWGLWENRRTEYWTLIFLLIAALIGLSQPGRFYPHYYIQIVPILCLFSAPVFSAIWSEKRAFNYWLIKPKASKAWLLITVSGFLISHSIGIKNDWEITEAGEYLRTHSLPTDKIFVWGQSTNLYLDAQRKAATRYVAAFPLTGYIFGSPLSWDTAYDTSDRIVPGAWENLKDDFKTSLPDYMIDCDAARAVPRYPVAQFPYLEAILDNCYELKIKTRDGDIYKRKEGDCPEIRQAIR